MKFSQQIDQYFAHLALVQKELTNPSKDNEAKILTKNGKNYTFMYVSLPSTIEHIRPVLYKHGFSHSQGVAMHENGYLVTCVLGHASGQWGMSEVLISFSSCTTYQGEAKIPVFDEKRLGAMITYFRRYLLTSMVGICGDEDLDGIPDSDENVYNQPFQSKPIQKAVSGSIQPVPRPTPQPTPVSPQNWPSRANNVGQSHLSEAQLKRLWAITKQYGWTTKQVKDLVSYKFQKDSSSDLTKDEYDYLTQLLQSQKPETHEVIK